MTITRSIALAIGALALAACGGDDGDDAGFDHTSCDDIQTAHCKQIKGGDSKALQAAVNSLSLEANTTFVLGEGTFVLDNQVTIRKAGFHLVGQGIDVTVLDFAAATAQTNGVDAISDGFLVQDLTVRDAKKDGIRVESSNGVTFRRIRSTWTTPSLTSNGAYGIYPVKSQNVLVEDSRAENASDAGLYVGQCQNVIVRNNVVSGNVAGLEIENTAYADVYGNTAEDNTGGIVVFDLPGNPIIGRDVRLRDNIIRNNNHVNFAVGGTTVASIPAGTGTFAMASRRVEITNNTYQGNKTGDIAIINGLVIGDPVPKWNLKTSDLVGDWQDLGLMKGTQEGTVANFRSENILVAGNKHSGSGTAPDTESPLGIGILLKSQYGDKPVDSVLYDGLGESAFDAADPLKNSNDNGICVGGNTAGTMANMHLDAPGTAFFRPTAPPFAPYDCTVLKNGAVKAVTLP